MIDKSFVLKNAPTLVGEQVHVNHEGCSAGVDRKKRLYIKRTPTGLIAFCHHCGEKAFAQDAKGRLATWLTTRPRASIEPPKRLPTLSDLPVLGIKWLLEHDCDYTDKNFSGVRGEPYQVCLDIMDATGELIGYQIRNLLPNPRQKYITQYFSQNHRADSSWFYNGCKTLVITEDYLSAYRVNKDTGCSSVALLRTSISNTTLQQIADLGFNMVYIWLDDDSAGRKGADKAKHDLRLYLDSNIKIININSREEPKQCTKQQLREVLLG